jgi:hypothetical protein
VICAFQQRRQDGSDVAVVTGDEYAHEFSPWTWRIVTRVQARDGRGADGRRQPARQRRPFFTFRRDIFDYLRPGEELVEEPFARLIATRQLLA